MRLPAYGRTLLDARLKGDLPWLAVVAVGAIVDRGTLRGDKGIARLGVPFDCNLEQLDFSVLFGLNVLVSLFGASTSILEPRGVQAEFHESALAAIWRRGQPGTLWLLDRSRAQQLLPFPVRRGQLDLTATLDPLPLNAGFRAGLERRRELAILGRDGLFAQAEFDAVRSGIAHRWSTEHARV